MSEKIEEFLEQTPVFTLNELVSALGNGAARNSKSTFYNLVKNRRRSGRLGVVKEGVYFIVRPGQTISTAPVDSFLLASRLAPDAVLAFHTALDILGFGHSLFHVHYYFSKNYRRPVRFRSEQFRAVKVPQKLLHAGKETFGTEKVERLGVKIVTTGKERTLVEALEHPEYCGGFEEMYRCLEKMPYLQHEVVLQYLDLRAQKNLFVMAGFFLEQHREDFHIEESFLQSLERNKPIQPLYWDRSRKNGILIKRWNLIVPKAAIERSWEEF
ncbi:MAG: type IV toxin-antitoxin system AbiEi family antitoxin domain-containing protein [bacterium]